MIGYPNRNLKSAVIKTHLKLYNIGTVCGLIPLAAVCGGTPNMGIFSIHWLHTNDRRIYPRSGVHGQHWDRQFLHYGKWPKPILTFGNTTSRSKSCISGIVSKVWDLLAVLGPSLMPTNVSSRHCVQSIHALPDDNINNNNNNNNNNKQTFQNAT